MKTRTTGCAILIAIAALTSCSSDNTADPAACKAAMEKQFDDALASGKEGSRPAECDGIDDKTLQKFVGEIAGEQLDKSLGDSLNDLETTAP